MLGDKTIHRHGIEWKKVTVRTKRDLLTRARDRRRARIIDDLKLSGADTPAIFGELQAFDREAYTIAAWFDLLDSIDGRADLLELCAAGAEPPPISEAEEAALVADLCGITLKPAAESTESEPAEDPTKPGEESYGTLPSSGQSAA